MKTFVVIVLSHSWHPRFSFDCVVNEIIDPSFVDIKSWWRSLRLDKRIHRFVRCWRKTLFLSWFWRRSFINCCGSHFGINSSVIFRVIWCRFFAFDATFINITTSVWAVFEASFQVLILSREVFLIRTNIWELVFLHLIDQFFSVCHSWRFRRQYVLFIV